MQFKLATLVGVGLLVSNTQAFFSPANVIDVIEHITDISSDVEEAIEDTSIVTAAEKIPGIISDVLQIASTVASDLSGEDNADDFDKEDQLKVCSTFKRFITEEEQLVTTVIEKGASIIASPLPFSYFLSVLFRNIDDVVDKLFAGVVDLVPVCADELRDDRDKHNGLLDKVFDTLQNENQD